MHAIEAVPVPEGGHKNFPSLEVFLREHDISSVEANIIRGLALDYFEALCVPTQFGGGTDDVERLLETQSKLLRRLDHIKTHSLTGIYPSREDLDSAIEAIRVEIYHLATVEVGGDEQGHQSHAGDFF